MKITDITIENYKSVKQLTFKPNLGLNVIIGENSVGKSNVFDAINWLLGPTYPTFNQTTKQDHFLGDINNKIKIIIIFNDNTRMCLDESKDKYQFTMDRDGNLIREISDERLKYACAYLDVSRQIIDYMPSNKWTLIGRILQEINEQFCKETDSSGVLKKDKFKEELQKIKENLLFSVKNSEGKEVMKDFIKILQKESARQLNRPESEFIVDLDLYDPWNFYRTLQILVRESDIGLEFQASNLGMGIQASISVAILKAYSEIHLNNKSPIFIDEPELFLHPQAQRNFYQILRKIAEEGTQIFYTSHSPNFLSADHFDEIFVVRKLKDKGTVFYFASLDKFINDLKIRTGINSDKDVLLEHYKNACDETGDSQKANEAFFAKKIILVEGSSESLALPYFFELLEYDYIKEGVTIVKCGGKKELDRFYRLYSEFGIPCYVIFDGDKQLHGLSGEQNNICLNKVLFQLLNVSPTIDYPDGQARDSYIGFEQEFENNLGFAIPQNCKGLDLYLKIKELMKDKENLPVWIKDVVINVVALKQENVKSVLVNDLGQEQSKPENDIPF